MNLERVPLAVSGDWGGATMQDVHAVVSSARTACVGGATFPIGGPKRIDVVGIPSRPCPMVHAEDRADGSARILLTVRGRQWAQLAYQFGHELGHVAANSWKGDAIPRPPSHWLEEGLVEAFSLAGLLRMEAMWPSSPPYPNWASYAPALGDYARTRLAELRTSSHQGAFEADPAAWFKAQRPALEPQMALTIETWPIVPTLVDLLQANPDARIDLSALNTWRDRSMLPIEDYMAAWELSCRAGGMPGTLPRVIRALLAI